jgi:hypothetical protein
MDVTVLPSPMPELVIMIELRASPGRDFILARSFLYCSEMYELGSLMLTILPSTAPGLTTGISAG